MRLRFASTKQITGDGWRFRGFSAFGSPPTLRVGSTGAAVTDLQEMLNASGYNAPINGTFDAVATLLAVTNFQLASGLKPDGIVGPLTWGKLNPSYKGPATASSSVGVTVGKVTIEKVTPSGGGLQFDPMLILGGALVLFAGYKLIAGR